MKRQLILAFILCALCVSAHARVVHVKLQGTAQSVDDPDSLLPFGDIEVGITQLISEFDLDLDTRDGQINDPNFGYYLGALSNTSLTANGITLRERISNIANVFNDIENTNTGSFTDIWFADGNVANYDEAGFPIGTVVKAVIFFSSGDTAAPVPPLTSDELVAPFLSPDWGAMFIEGRISTFDPTTSESVTLASIYAPLESIEITPIPIPTAFWFFTSSLGLLGWMTRKERMI